MAGTVRRPPEPSQPPMCTHVLRFAAMDDGTRPNTSQKVGVRELRNQVAAVMRRAGSGERVIITVDGRPAAQLGPLDPPVDGFTIDDLVATGLAQPPARSDRPRAPEAEDVPVDVRPDDVLDDLRGR